MELYYLGQPMRPMSNPLGGVHKVAAVSAEGRERALADAYSRGATFAVVMVGYCDVLRVLRAQGQRKPIKPDANHDHGFLLYMERMLTEYCSMVLVPPLGAITQDSPVWQEFAPVVPMVAAYRVESPWDGYAAAQEGRRVITVTDYGYNQAGPTLEEPVRSGKAQRKAYVQALESILGPGVRPWDER